MEILAGGEVAALMHEAEMHIVPELERLKSTQLDRHDRTVRFGSDFFGWERTVQAIPNAML
jgi:hypothetical protein